MEWAQASSAKDWEQISKIENAEVREALKQIQTVKVHTGTAADDLEP